MKPDGRRHSQIDAQRLEAAAEWMERLRDAAASEAEIVSWVQWYEADARNQQAYERVRELWTLSGGLAEEVVDGELLAARPAAPRRRTGALRRARGTLVATTLDFFEPLSVRRRRVAVLGAACACVLALGLGWTLRDQSEPSLLDDDAVVAPSTETVHAATLSDGSRVELAANSLVTVHYDEAQRNLSLDSGEGFFSVAHNPRRPFIVAAGDVRIRAVGTAFNVRHAADRVVVTVTEGVVKVYRTGAQTAAVAEGDAVVVSAGGQVSWDEGQKDPTVGAVDPQAVLGWREGRLEYNNEPLGAVIADLNRYTRRPVFIHGDVGKLRFSGTLLTSATDEWLRALPSEFPVEVLQQGSGIVIQARAGAAHGD